MTVPPLLRRRALAVVFSLLGGSLSADLRLPALFSDHLVLQADQPMPVWGWCDPATGVKVVFTDEKGAEKAAGSATAGSDGRWEVLLPAMTAGLAGRLSVQTAKGEKKEIADLLVGEVWLGGGQSNMSYKVGSSNVAAETLAEAKEQATAAKSAIRFFMTEDRGADTPQDDVPGKWVVAAPDNVAGCSAVAWYFGVALHEKLHRPVGLIVSAIGGTRAEAWMPKSAFEATSVASAIWKRHEGALARYTPESEKKNKEEIAAWQKLRGPNKGPKPHLLYCPTDKNVPNRLYNGMIAGLGAYAVKGAIWFQADGNNGHPEEYGELIQALIKSWRQQWKKELPFFYVEMNNMRTPQEQPYEKLGEEMCFMREQQTAALRLPKTGVVATIDLGRVGNPTFNPHFPVKKPVGDRLANVALTEVYGFSQGEVYSPEFAGYAVEGDKVRLRFKHADGLRATGDGSVKGFIAQKPDGTWVWAEGKVDGKDILVWSAEVPKPRDVRYAWACNPVISIENGAGLPLRPFRVEMK
jgi:sialate O-acetylesterase